MNNVETIQGEIFVDERGQISSLNSFIPHGVKRLYFIHHPSTSTVRGWHGHKLEKKWFYCVKGSFVLALVKPDDWDNPSQNLKAEIIQLNEKNSKIIAVPEGYANCLKAQKEDSILLVLSGKKLPEAYQDSWRYDNSMWVDWSQY